MSYDIDIYTKKIHYSANYTSNVYPMFQLAYEKAQAKEEHLKDMGEYKWRELIFEDFKDCFNGDRECTLRTLKLMLKELEASPEEFKKLDPENGWGDYEGAVEFLRGVYIALLENVSAVASIDY